MGRRRQNGLHIQLSVGQWRRLGATLLLRQAEHARERPLSVPKCFILRKQSRGNRVAENVSKLGRNGQRQQRVHSNVAKTGGRGELMERDPCFLGDGLPENHECRLSAVRSAFASSMASSSRGVGAVMWVASSLAALLTLREEDREGGVGAPSLPESPAWSSNNACRLATVGHSTKSEEGRSLCSFLRILAVMVSESSEPRPKSANSLSGFNSVAETTTSWQMMDKTWSKNPDGALLRCFFDDCRAGSRWTGFSLFLENWRFAWLRI
ncbi:hypothetical protein VTK56DRAFT_9204 [Thermocarpiscus australiensis]